MYEFNYYVIFSVLHFLHLSWVQYIFLVTNGKELSLTINKVCTEDLNGLLEKLEIKEM
jgi:hypothetical protein